MNTQELVALCNQQFNEKFGENPEKIVFKTCNRRRSDKFKQVPTPFFCYHQLKILV